MNNCIFRNKLSILLNPEKVLLSEDGCYRDWRGISILSELNQSEYSLVSQSQDKLEKLLELWIEKNKENGTEITLSQLQNCLGAIDRYDVYDDVATLLGMFLPNTNSKLSDNLLSCFL